jgi:hypothetical protein
VQARPKSSCSTANAGDGFICAMTMHEGQDEVGATLAQIAMIAEEVNVIALVGSGAGCTYAGDMRQRIRHAVSF